MRYYNETVSALASLFNTNLQHGLSYERVQQQLAAHGPNTLPEPPKDSWIMVFLRQFKSPLVYVLLAAAGIIVVVGNDVLDASIISVVIIFNAFVGAVQEGRAQRMVAQLKKFVQAKCVVIRQGRESIIDAQELVPGDVIVILDGIRVPADARIIHGYGLRVDEAVLTGESGAVLKHDKPLPGELPLYEQHNMLFKGTYVLAGSGHAVVVATGTATAFGAIHLQLSLIDTDMPLKKEIDRLTRFILIAITGVCLFLFLFGMLQGQSLQELFIMLTALFMCVVPEGLPVVLTLALVSGVYRMAQRKVLVKRMQAVEALGRANALIIDKTGTLTRNELMVSVCVTPDNVYDVAGVGYSSQGSLRSRHANNGNAYLQDIAYACERLATVHISQIPATGLYEIRGDPTDAALAVFAQKLSVEKKSYTKQYEIPFDSAHKYHAGWYESEGTGTLYVVGSPDTLCTYATNKSPCNNQEVSALLEQGLRVIALARARYTPTSPLFATTAQAHEFLQRGIEIIGFLGMQDTIRPEVADSIAQARASGIRVIMATGDHQKTALLVAKSTGIVAPGDRVITGPEFEALGYEQQAEVVRQATVYARVTPLQKMKIIEHLQDQGALVGMTGDGVNDAPALAQADLGIAMGGIGTEVAQEAADMILLDDSFSNIVSAIEQGRHIFYTLRRVILYFFATNFGEILVVLYALILDLPLPITPAQILWLNLVTDGFLDMALTMEPQEPGLLGRQWLARAKLVDRYLVAKMFFMAIPMGVCSIAVFYMHYHHDLVYARTATLLTMAMFQWFNAWNCRSETKSVFTLGLFSNRWLLLAIVVVFCLQIVVLHVPLFQYVFKTVPLATCDWIIILVLSSSLFVLDELRKLVVRRWYPEDV